MSASRYIDLVVSVRLADVENDASGRPRWKTETDEQLVRVGGRWDRRRRRWVTGLNVKTSRLLILRFHRGQEESARWFASWLLAFASNEWTAIARVWAVLLVGGRRSGKTHLACAILIVFAVMTPRARIWAISPTLETGDELDQNFRELMPRDWARRRQAKTGRATTYTFANGSVILLRSGVKPERLKAGRVDLALINEGQEIDERAYFKLRAAVADRGGLVIVTANPPERPIGRWIEEFWIRARARAADVVEFTLDPRKNPLIVFDALLSMAKEVDEKTMMRDVLGLFAPIGDTVFHAWSDVENWKDPPPGLVDITAQVARRALGREAGDIVGMDFQRIPAMVGIVHRVFRAPTGDELLWVVDEAVVDEADENELVDALEAMARWRPGDLAPDKREIGRAPYRGWIEPNDARDAPAHATCVIDASGFFQDGDHTQGRTSDRYLKARRWTFLHKPQRDSDKNPAIVERMKTGNMLLKSAEGVRRLFVARHCARTAKALRHYENKNGVPNRRSEYAHIVDAVTYVAYRLYGRPKVKAPPGPGYFGAGQFDRDELYRNAI